MYHAACKVEFQSFNRSCFDVFLFLYKKYLHRGNSRFQFHVTEHVALLCCAVSCATQRPCDAEMCCVVPTSALPCGAVQFASARLSWPELGYAVHIMYVLARRKKLACATVPWLYSKYSGVVFCYFPA